jgi:hypothetical protein
MRVYTFYQSGTIPGIPGEFSAGTRVTTNEDETAVVKIELTEAAEQTTDVPEDTDIIEEGG